jgi:short-subunit dehydrogenase
MKKTKYSLFDFSDVVVTGGSSGIGRELIEQLYHLNKTINFYNLSRSKPDVENLKHILIKHYFCDLSSRTERNNSFSSLVSDLQSVPNKRKILVINNSGFGAYGPFPSPDVETHLNMIEVNIAAPTHLCGALLPLLREFGGAVMNIASTAAFQPTPLLSTYGATKSYLLDWSLSLQQDWQEFNIPVLAVCPGPTSTNFFSNAGFKKPPVSSNGGWSSQTPPQVVRESLKALEDGKSLIVTGWNNKILSSLSSKTPKSLIHKISYQILKKMRLEQFQ